MSNKKDRSICVIGLGYVGLPILVAFAKKQPVIGFDISQKRVSQLLDGYDGNNEVEPADLKNENIHITSKAEDIKFADFYIITVPTPVDEGNRPDLSYLISASEIVGEYLKKEDIVVYESTVYPGATEEDCLPILEKKSLLKVCQDFGLGYSPERINPGDKNHTFTKIKKIISASDPSSLKIIAEVYGSVVEAGLHSAPSIKVAEAAKIIENTQRDLNISLMNEIAIIFDKMNIDTRSVLEAAGTKWNFLKFYPGLVGGHCISIDPYYLAYKAEKLGYYPQVILSGRRINDNMGKMIADKTIKKMIETKHNIAQSRVTVFGITFKENCPDIRNSRVVDVIKELKSYGVEVQIHDPLANADEVFHEYQLRLTHIKELKPANALVFAVHHSDYEQFNLEQYQKLTSPQGVVIDVKGLCPAELLVKSNFHYWRL